MNIIFLFLLTFSFSILNGAAESKTAELRAENVHGATLIAGNLRGPGGVNILWDIVEQENADFSHRSSFPGNEVISVDMGSCTTDQAHIQGNWLTLPFAENSQNRVMFEWFPSYDITNASRLMFPAVNEAYKRLADGGELIIDHYPHFIISKGDFKETLEAFRKQNIKIPIEVIEKLSKVERKNLEIRENIMTPGILAMKWQEYDPFSICMSEQERRDILNHCYRIHKQFADQAPVLDIQTNPEAINTALSTVAQIFKKDLSWVIRNLVLKMKRSDDSSLVSMTEWVYGMYSRGPAMLEALRTMGFEVAADAMQYHEINPYNGRRHAWIIKGRKPATITTAAEEKEDI